MSPAQNTLYWRLWGQVRKVDPAADRKAMHAEPSDNFPDGLPESHTAWNNRHLDEWIARCSAIAQPGSFNIQNRQAGMDATRGRVFLRHLLCALQKPEKWLEGIVVTMSRNRRVAYGKSGVFVDALDRQRIDNLIIAVKKECRRVWPTKGDLLRSINDFSVWHDVDDRAAVAAILKALNRSSLGRGIETFVYEDLLIVLSAMRGMLSAEDDQVEVVADREYVPPENIPF